METTAAAAPRMGRGWGWAFSEGLKIFLLTGVFIKKQMWRQQWGGFSHSPCSRAHGEPRPGELVSSDTKAWAGSFPQPVVLKLECESASPGDLLNRLLASVLFHGRDFAVLTSPQVMLMRLPARDACAGKHRSR